MRLKRPTIPYIIWMAVFTVIPIVLILSFVQIRKERRLGGEGNNDVNIIKIFPMFILWFIVASLITTVLTSVLNGNALVIAERTFDILKDISKFLIVMAMSAIGLNTNIVKLVKTGAKPITLGFLCWIAITCVSLLMQKLLNIW